MEPESLGNLIDQLADALVLFARSRCDEPEDVVQDAFMKLASQTKPPRNPAAWLFRTVRNGAVNAGIASQRRRRREAEAGATKADWFEPQPSAGSVFAVDPESAQVALDALPVEQREIIVARLWGGLTFEQIANLTETSSSSAHRLYQAGLVTLRARLGVPCRTNPS
ncbi:MAG: RNA polymerase sigma factor [Isosphaeraceae bacterium]